MNNYIAYMSGGKFHTLLYAQSALQSIADKADLFVRSGEGFFVLFMLSAITFFVMLHLLNVANARVRFLSDASDAGFEALNMLNHLRLKGYVRNRYGVIQPVDDWMENGSREPKRKPKKAKAVKAKTKTHQPRESKQAGHQLKMWMQVLNATGAQKEAIHNACVAHGINGEELDTLNIFTHIFFDGSCVRGGFVRDDYEDINIPFDEFMARIRGMWVEPVSQKEMEKLIADVSTLNLPEVKSD